MKNQLFLIHFAGGSVYSYDFLKKYINSNEIEFLPIELPGRGKRYDEELLNSLEDCIDDYFNQIKNLRNGKPFIIYGHSMGASLGLFLAQKLEEINDFPVCLIVSGNAGPGIEKDRRYKNLHLLDKISFKKELRIMGGMPELILDNEELYNHFEKIIRSDFESLSELDLFDVNSFCPIKTNLYAIMGNEEETSDKIDNWKNFTTGNFKKKILKGNHFFIYENAELISSIIEKSSV